MAALLVDDAMCDGEEYEGVMLNFSEVGLQLAEHVSQWLLVNFQRP